LFVIDQVAIKVMNYSLVRISL